MLLALPALLVLPERPVHRAKRVPLVLQGLPRLIIGRAHPYNFKTPTAAGVI